MNKNFKKISKIITILLAVIFLIQSVSNIKIIPLDYVLNILGIDDNIYDISMAIIYLVALLFVISVILFILNKFKIVKGITRNKIILNMIVQFFMALIIFLPAFASIFIFSGFGLFGEGVKIALKNGKTLSDINPIIFLNVYLFWYFIITTFFKPEIEPEFGLTEEEKEGLI